MTAYSFVLKFEEHQYFFTQRCILSRALQDNINMKIFKRRCKIISTIAANKMGYPHNMFLISQRKHTLQVLIICALMF